MIIPKSRTKIISPLSIGLVLKASNKDSPKKAPIKKVIIKKTTILLMNRIGLFTSFPNNKFIN